MWSDANIGQKKGLGRLFIQLADDSGLSDISKHKKKPEKQKHYDILM